MAHRNLFIIEIVDEECNRFKRGDTWLYSSLPNSNGIRSRATSTLSSMTWHRHLDVDIWDWYDINSPSNPHSYKNIQKIHISNNTVKKYNKYQFYKYIYIAEII